MFAVFCICNYKYVTTHVTINANDVEKIQNNTIATLTNICLAVKAMWQSTITYIVFPF